MKNKLIFGSIIVVIAFLVWLFLLKNSKNVSEQYAFSTVKRGNIETTITTTGTLQAIGTVEVGTQVSGIIDRILVDFNDDVKKNQVLAILDTTTLAVAIREAKAGVQQAQALFDQAQYVYNRNADLFRQKLVSEQDYISSKTSFSTSEAALKSANISLERAASNLNYAFIRSPIDGNVIYRSVEEGQTVAASFSTPTLFTIAEDLTKMEIYAMVDESDIGTVKEEQTVRFTIQTYQDLEFTGKVRQIWLQPETVSNVVNYTVVINAENPDQLLLPGMTATVDFIIDSRENVLLIPNSALKIQAAEKMLNYDHKQRQAKYESLPDSIKVHRNRQPGNVTETVPAAPDLENMAIVWYLNDQNQAVSTMIRTGLSNTKYTELVFGPDIRENMQLISSILDDGSTQTNESNSRSGFGGPGGPGGPPPF